MFTRYELRCAAAARKDFFIPPPCACGRRAGPEGPAAAAAPETGELRGVESLAAAAAHISSAQRGNFSGSEKNESIAAGRDGSLGANSAGAAASPGRPTAVSTEAAGFLRSEGTEASAPSLSTTAAWLRTALKASEPAAGLATPRSVLRAVPSGEASAQVGAAAAVIAGDPPPAAVPMAAVLDSAGAGKDGVAEVAADKQAGASQVTAGWNGNKADRWLGDGGGEEACAARDEGGVGDVVGRTASQDSEGGALTKKLMVKWLQTQGTSSAGSSAVAPVGAARILTPLLCFRTSLP
jgi:hypothetical protein